MTSSCATKETTSGRRSTGPAGCAIWRTAARRCCRGATEAMVIDGLPAKAWLADLGSYQLRDLPRPERVLQLCHPDLPKRLPAAANPENCCRA